MELSDWLPLETGACHDQLQQPLEQIQLHLRYSPSTQTGCLQYPEISAIQGDQQALCNIRGQVLNTRKPPFFYLNINCERIHPIGLLSGKWEAEAIDTATEITSDCSLARVEESTNSGERKEQQWSRRRQWGAEAIDTQLGVGETSAEVFTSFWELQKLDFRMSDERYCRKRRAAEFRAQLLDFRISDERYCRKRRAAEFRA